MRMAAATIHPLMLLSPILLSLSPDSWRFRVFDLHPIRRAPRPIKRAEPLRHDPLAAEPASVLEENIAVAFENLVQDNSVMRAAHPFCQYALALLDWRTPQVFAVQLDQIEREQHWTQTATADIVLTKPTSLAGAVASYLIKSTDFVELSLVGAQGLEPWTR